ARYDAALAQMPALTLPTVREGVAHAYHLYPVLLNMEMLRVDRRQVFEALRAEGIGVNVHYIPVYWHPYYVAQGYERGACPVAEDAYMRLLSLPIFPDMTEADQDDVLAALEKVLAAYRR
ncbi:MAG: DegT/DnrJ/EryC1/StrS family aminotransferase, partial [Anaerolineales bacterium]